MEVRPGYKQSEIGVIPEEWETKSFAKLFAFSNGVNADKSSYGKGFRFVNVLEPITYSHIRGPEIAGRVSLPKSVADAYAVRRGDVLFNRTSETDTELGLAATYVGAEHVVFGGFVIRGRPTDESLDPTYSGYALRASVIRSQVIPMGQGAVRANIGQQSLGLVVAPVPPLSEQRAIAAALNDVDALLGGLDQLIAKKRDLKQAAMQQLLTGQTRLPGFHGEWDMKRLGDCLLAQPDYGINAPGVAFSDRLPTYIRITDITEQGRFRPDPRVSVRSALADKYMLNEGDIVFARTGASVGKAYRYRPEDGPLVFAGFLIRVRPNPISLVSAYLAAYVTTTPYWDWVTLMSMRTGQPGINGNEYAQLPICLPPVPEQSAIAAVLANMDAELSVLETRRTKTRALKQAMMQELLTGRIRLA